MYITVEVQSVGDVQPPVGAPLRVEARDTSLADAPSTTLATAVSTVRGSGKWLETVELDLPTLPRRCTIWAHVDVDGDGRVSKGDFVTSAAYPVTAPDQSRLDITVRRV